VRRRLALALGASFLALGGCPAGDTGSDDAAELRVLAAASLTEPFTTLAEDFEDDHPGVEVQLAFDSSATLAEQVAQGAPADVLATADESTMQTVVHAGLTAGEPQVFATNHLVLAVPAGNPAGLSRLADLERPGVAYVVCVESAPCGRLAATVLETAGITADPASEEVDVKAVLGKVQLDEADAGLVYASDVAGANDAVERVDIPGSEQQLTSYPVTTLTDAAEPGLAREWVELVRSARGRRVLARAGFGAP
jgi:molybdate transport system substrate-binding protein